MWKVATWNIRGRRGKEQELVQEFENAKLDVLAICETKKEGKGELETDGRHLMIFSGVEQVSRDKKGGCIIRQEGNGDAIGTREKNEWSNCVCTK